MAYIRERPSRFTQLSQAAARWTSRSRVLFGVLAAVIMAGLTGPHFDYSPGWQLIMSTAVTIVTFLIVQTSQNRAVTAMQIKLDELLKAVEGAKDRLAEIEELDEEQLERLHREYQANASSQRLED
ncbi:low affinity iron permease family protein [Bosea sp. 2RAB26]|uniref:low affinity iron permease family protein n=1 Tax=Bosea sp. 2RAB26 TaxID=3237476 RepID=UPI003F8DB463